MTDDRRNDTRRKPAGSWQADFAHLPATASTKYSYEIKARARELGGGWQLQLLEDGQEVGGGVFPVPPPDPQEVITWWNRITPKERGRWVLVAGSAVPDDAWQAWRDAEAYTDAEAEANDWIATRTRESSGPGSVP
jgi:hypothetical protein